MEGGQAPVFFIIGSDLASGECGGVPNFLEREIPPSSLLQENPTFFLKDE